MLYKRTIVETIFGKLKQFQRLWHSKNSDLSKMLLVILWLV
ncbi:hypothetical protein MIDIC_250024 [Alphaproteobacteria bacterium]